MDQQDINAILGNLPPWASEETLQSVANNFGGMRLTLTQVVAQIGKLSPADVRKIAKEAEDAKNDANKGDSKATAVGKELKKSMDITTSGSSAANAVAELSHEAAKHLANAGIATGNFTSRFGIAGKGAAAVLKGVGTGGVAATGLAMVFAKLMTEQEKLSRSFIEFGSTVSDQQMWTTLRSKTRLLGMGLKDYVEMTEAAKPFIVSAGKSAYMGQRNMADFIDSIDKNDGFNDFGFSIQDQARFITQETETLYQTGQVTEFNAQTKKRVLEGFESANKLALFTGNILGTQRDEALKLRDEARNNVELQTALIQNTKFIQEKYGETADKNITDAVGFFAILNNSTMGQEFAENFSDDVASTLNDISYDQSAVNNIDTDFLAKLRLVGPGVAEEYIQMVEDTATGQITTEEQATERQRAFVKMIRDGTMRVSAYAPELFETTKLITLARIIPDSYFKADLSGLADNDYIAKLVENADTSIDVIDNVSVSFQNLQEVITPGFDTLGTGFSVLTGGLMGLGKGLAKLFGKEHEDRFNEIYARDLEKRYNESIDTMTSDNIYANIDAVKNTVQIRTESKNELLELIEDGKNPETEEDLTEEEIVKLQNQLGTLQDQIIELRIYEQKLLEKEGELTRQGLGLE